jgi:hypothetical protein
MVAFNLLLQQEVISHSQYLNQTIIKISLIIVFFKFWGRNDYSQLGIDNTTHMGDDSGKMAQLLGIDL